MKFFRSLSLITFCIVSLSVKAQTFDSLYINLYTDSLKKGTYNYINVEGITSNGEILPLDTSHIFFTTSSGKFFGNSLWIDSSCNSDRVTISATLKEKSPVSKTFVVFIKKNEDTGVLPTEEEIIRSSRKKSGKKD